MCFEFLSISETQSARNSKKNGQGGFFASLLSRLRNKGKSMGAVLGIFSPELSAFQKRKLMHEFRVFFDLNKDGHLEWKDFEIARQKICDMSGWKPGSEKYIKTHELFRTMWRQLSDDGDENNDGVITGEEWLNMWKKFNEQCVKNSKSDDPTPPEKRLPEWLEKYIEFKFNLYDRTGDGHIDVDEFEYVLSDFGVASKESRVCFLMFSQDNKNKVDMPYFKQLCAEYFRSNDPCALGNFINGKLELGNL